MNNFHEKYWVRFPLVSAFLIILAFYPLRIWPLAFVALVPLFYFLHASNVGQTRRVFWGSFIFGVIFSLSISYATLIQFHWLPEAYLFAWGVRLLFIPIALISGTIGGIISVTYIRLKSHSIALNGALLAALWVVGESIFYALMSRYHLGMLAYVASPAPGLIEFAGIGGVLLVSLIIALVNSYAAALVYAFQTDPVSFRKVGTAIVVIAAVLGFSLALHRQYLARNAGPEKRLRAAVIQNKEREAQAFGSFGERGFSFPHLEGLLARARAENPEVILYPFAPYIGALSAADSESGAREGIAGSAAEFGVWASRHLDSVIPLITWNTVFRDGNFYGEFDAWKGGELQQFYQKRVPFPFLDYTPAWAQRIGLYSTPFDVSSGPERQVPIRIADHTFSSVVCSEMHDTNRVDRDSDIILSLGSDAMFSDDAVGHLDLVNAQFRAAEYGMPAIRGNRFGPSAFIDQRGRIVARMNYGEEGILAADLIYTPNHAPTVYARLGDWGFYVLAGGIITCSLWRKRKVTRAI